MNTEIYIVAWTEDILTPSDHYELFSEHDYGDPEEAARHQYESVIEHGAYCASISKMVKGTDWS